MPPGPLPLPLSLGTAAAQSPPAAGSPPAEAPPRVLLTSGRDGRKLSVTLGGGSCLEPLRKGPSVPLCPASAHVMVYAAGRVSTPAPAALWPVTQAMGTLPPTWVYTLTGAM